MPGKITVRNYTTLTDYAALLRAGMYLAGKKEEAEDNGFRFKVTESERHGVVVKIAEEIRKGWEEARLCANLIREGKAKIMIATRKDGTTYRYTKPK